MLCANYGKIFKVWDVKYYNDIMNVTRSKWNSSYFTETSGFKVKRFSLFSFLNINTGRVETSLFFVATI